LPIDSLDEELDREGVVVPLTLEHGNVREENSEEPETSYPVVSDRVPETVYELVPEGV
jgi:hypothetical protein